MDGCEQSGSTRRRYSYPVCCQHFPLRGGQFRQMDKSPYWLLDQPMRPNADAFASEKSVSHIAPR